MASSELSARSVGFVAEGELMASSMPSAWATSSRLPNSEITVPIASFSLAPFAMSSLYLSSIICPSSRFARSSSGVSGSVANMDSR